jgi:hypothetical protein
MRQTTGIARLALVVGIFFCCAAPAFAGTSSNRLLACQKRVGAQVRFLAKLVGTKIHNCSGRVVTCNLAFEIDGKDPANCLAAAYSKYCEPLAAYLDTKIQRLKDRLAAACGTIPLADLEPYLAGLGLAGTTQSCAAADTTALTACIIDRARCSVEHDVFRTDPRALESLTAAGVAGSFPCVGPLP